MAEYLIQDTTLDAIADAINAKTGGSSAMTPEQMVTEIGSIPTGASITDGIVVKARDTNGKATEVDFYGTEIYQMQFYNYNVNNGTWSFVEEINFMDAVTTVYANGLYGCKSLLNLPASLERVEQSGCYYCGFVNLNLPNLNTVYGGSTFSSCKSLNTFVAPKLTTINGNYNFSGCTALTDVQLGSIGYAVPSIPNTTFGQCSQTGLTITVFTVGTKVDTITSNIRYTATNATIIIKASEATTYNGTSYAAGDTILTSEVTT